ncbi:transmembrane protein, putative [Medicago truncatula]|uniref:Transmembrane protein, putative n=1 Tax=Medicago truncatula TaxID=3880 RepID=G7IX85_MEDTR|nr:transmembrane protein, putative [Medicago truncatula]
MGRRRTGLVALLLVSCFKIARMLPRFTAFGVGRCCLSLFICWRLLRLCIDDDMSCMMTWLLGDIFYLDDC